MNYKTLTEELLQSEEPSIRWKIRVNVLGERRNSPEIRTLEEEIRRSPRVRTLLQNLGENGIYKNFHNVYDKWQGAHWVLMTLADLGYPRHDEGLRLMVNQVVDAWLGERAFNEFVAEKKTDAYKRRDAIPVMQGRHRTCASQQGNALYSVLALGLEDERIHQLAERLMHWQWPDGGWNCDKNPDASTSTFIHTLYSMRALALYAQHTGDAAARKSALRASEVFLARRLYKRVSNGKVIRREFIKLHYPLYWHYDILGALKAFAQIGMTDDERLNDALNLLEDKELLSGGWPAEARYYKKVSDKFSLNADFVDWGGTSKLKMNPWVTVDALYVLRCFGRLDK